MCVEEIGREVNNCCGVGSPGIPDNPSMFSTAALPSAPWTGKYFMHFMPLHTPKNALIFYFLCASVASGIFLYDFFPAVSHPQAGRLYVKKGEKVFFLHGQSLDL